MIEQCWKCKATGDAEDEFVNPHSGLCAKCHKDHKIDALKAVAKAAAFADVMMDEAVNCGLKMAPPYALMWKTVHTELKIKLHELGMP